MEQDPGIELRVFSTIQKHHLLDLASRLFEMKSTGPEFCLSEPPSLKVLTEVTRLQEILASKCHLQNKLNFKF